MEERDMSRTAGDVAGREIRAARALVGWRIADLARESRVSVPTIQNVEHERGGKPSTRAMLQRTLEQKGVVFLPLGGVGLVNDPVLSAPKLRPTAKTYAFRFSGEALRLARERAKWSVDRLAGHAGVSYDTVLRLEKMPVVSANQATINRLVRALGKVHVQIAGLRGGAN
jgi:transcriptional regulator with XRE-family HTH domain